MIYVVLIFIDIICILLVAVSVPIFFVREMRWAATKLLLTGIGGYVGSAVGYLITAFVSTFGGPDFPATAAAKMMWLTMLSTAILVGLGAGVRIGDQLASQLNRQRGWD